MRLLKSSVTVDLGDGIEDGGHPRILDLGRFSKKSNGITRSLYSIVQPIQKIGQINVASQ